MQFVLAATTGDSSRKYEYKCWGRQAFASMLHENATWWEEVAFDALRRLSLVITSVARRKSYGNGLRHKQAASAIACCHTHVHARTCNQGANPIFVNRGFKIQRTAALSRKLCCTWLNTETNTAETSQRAASCIISQHFVASRSVEQCVIKG